MFGLEPDTLAKIRDCLAQITAIEKVIIFGSRAKGNYRNGSDIDLTLLGSGLTLSNSVYPLAQSLDDLNLPYTFDLSIFSQIDNRELVEHIDRVGKIFYERVG